MKECKKKRKTPLIAILAVCLISLSGCGGVNSSKHAADTGNDSGDIISGSAANSFSDAPAEDEDFSAEDMDSSGNPYFPVPEDVYDWDEGTAYQAVLKTDKETSYETTVELSYSPFSEDIYNISIDVPDYDISPEYLDLGQFYIRPEAIYWLGTSRLCLLGDKELEKLITKGRIPEQLLPICRTSGITDQSDGSERSGNSAHSDGHDSSSHDNSSHDSSSYDDSDHHNEHAGDNGQEGTHVYYRVQGDEIISYRYDNSVQNGKYQMYVWKKQAGLVAYRMGFGFDGDLVCIWKEDLLSNKSVLKETFYQEKNGKKKAAEPFVTNPYFPYDGDSIQEFSALEETVISGKISWQTKLLDAGSHGTLYQIGFNRIYGRNQNGSELESEIFDGRTNSAYNWYAYLWVTKKEVYYIDYMTVQEYTGLIKSGTLAKQASCICKENESADPLAEDKVGRHESIRATKDGVRHYSSYSINNKSNPEGRSLLRFSFKKQVGLIKYFYAATSAGAGSILVANEKYVKTDNEENRTEKPLQQPFVF